MADADSTAAFLDAVATDVGDIDIVVNNVGASPSRNFLYMSDDDWTSLFELNLMSAVRCTRAFLPHMREQRWGRIVMVSTGAAKNPDASLVDYAASKAAMVSVAKSLARKYGADNVLVNSVLPGLVRTAMWERAASEIAQSSDTDVESVIAARAANVPLGRFGTSEEIANVVLFLCSEHASYVNGAAIDVDGETRERDVLRRRRQSPSRSGQPVAESNTPAGRASVSTPPSWVTSPWASV